MDASFCATGVLQLLDDFGCEYVIRIRKTSRVKKLVDPMQTDVRVVNDYTFRGKIDETQQARLYEKDTNLVMIPSHSGPDNTVVFLTNYEVSNQSEEARQEAERVVNPYSRRWGIENSYKTIKDFLAWTTSKEFVVRLFYFGFAVLLYNMWWLVDLLVQVSLDIDRRNKPRVTAKRFLNLAHKQLSTG